MPHLRKEALVRLATKDSQRDEINPVTGLIKLKDSERFERTKQVLEVLSWLESTVDAMSWFSSHHDKKSDRLIDTIAYRISLKLGLPRGLIRKIISYSLDVEIQQLRALVNNRSVSTIIAALLWIACTSSYSELLVYLFGLYDMKDEDCLNSSTMYDLLADVILSEIPVIPEPKVCGDKRVRILFNIIACNLIDD